MLCFKFHQNRTVNKEFDFFEMGGGRVIEEPIFIKCNLIIIDKHLQMCFNFNQNRPINEDFVFWGVKGAILRDLGVVKVGTTWIYVPRHHIKLFLYAICPRFYTSPADY